jgi:hypothetical protein
LKTASVYFTRETVPLFTDIFVEDINQFNDVELWLQIAALVNKETHLVFSGDPLERFEISSMNLPQKLATAQQNPFDRYLKAKYVDDM